MNLSLPDDLKWYDTIDTNYVAILKQTRWNKLSPYDTCKLKIRGRKISYINFSSNM